MTNLTFKVNITNTDTVAGGNFQTVLAADSFIFSAGSAAVIDGADIPTQSEINAAATLLSPSVATIVAHYFLADVANNLLKEIHLAGNSDKRYAFLASFDGATATEPQLEAWDDITLATYALGCLGLGTPANSWYKAICTTTTTPRALWTGTPLAGSGFSNVVPLNAGNGALPDLVSGESAHDLYFNFHVKIPAAYLTAGQYLPVLVITFTTN